MARKRQVLAADALIKAATQHPLRREIFRILTERGVGSPSELAKTLDAPLGVVSYHVRQLHESDLLVLVKRVPRRGAMEHYYELAPAAPVVWNAVEALQASLIALK